MDKEKIIIRLSTQVDTLKAHVNRLKKSGYNVHSLDVDMLRQKTIEFYELVFELENNVNDVETEPEKIVVPDAEPSITQPPVSENEVEDVEVIQEEIVEEKPAEDETVEVVEKIETIEEVVIEEPVVVPPPPSEPEPKPEPKVAQPEPIIEKQVPVKEIEPKEKPSEQPEDNTSSPQTTYDLFSGNSDNAVAEKFQATEEQSLADKMQKSSITNIREAIGINEKFLFINELFNGDLGRYNKILDDINDLPTKKGVDTYLLELKIQFQWADENEAYVKLKELLDRKFN